MSNTPYHDLYSTGFHDILPIIPAGAPISANSPSLSGREGTKNDPRGKLPGLKRRDGWVGMSAWTECEIDPDDFDDWAEMGAGVGLRCNDVVAIDIDVTDQDLVDMIQSEALLHLGFAPVRIGNAPKSLLVFRLAERDLLPTKWKIDFTDYSGTAHAVELLGAKQQFVVNGIHPKTQKPYTWSEPLTEWGLDGLTVVNLQDLRTFLDAVIALLTMFDCEVADASASGERSWHAPEDLRSPDPELIQQAVNAIPNEPSTDREFFVSMAHACWAADAGGETGFAAFQEWCDRWPPGNDPDEVDRVYRTIHSSTIGIEWLLTQARKHGFDSAGADFETGPVQQPDDTPEPIGTQAFEWEDWVYVNSLKRFYHRSTGNWLDKENFDDYHILLGDGDVKPHKFFINHRRDYCWADKPTYAPGNPNFLIREQGSICLNSWNPGPAHSGEWEGTSSDEDVRLWLQLGEHLIPDATERGHLLDYMAHLLQRPNIKPNWHPLIGSPIHGTGKDSLFVPLVKGLGEGERGNVATIRTTDLEGQWTWWAENKQLVVVSEIASFERRSVMQRLKSYMAAPPDTIEINKKGMPQYEVPNRFGMVMFTNQEDASAIERHDRRFFVIWSEAGKLDQAWYDEYHRWLGTEEHGSHWTGCKAVVQWLMARDISAFNPRGNAPATAAKEAMRKAAMPAMDALLEDAIENETGPFENDLVAMEDVTIWLRGQLKNQMPSPQKVAVAMRSMGARQLGRARAHDRRVSIWCCRRHTMYQDLEMALLARRLEEMQEASAGAAADFGT